MWYAAYVVYLLDPEIGSEDEAVVSLQEDTVLIEAPHSEGAYAKVIAFAAEVGEFGQGLLNNDAEALGQLGIELDSPAATTHREISGTNSIVHPSMASVYRHFSFLGLKDLVALRSGVGHEAEIDMRLSTSDSETQTAPMAAEALEAFSPAGLAYAGTERIAEEGRLYRRYSWYLAEQLYWERDGDQKLVRLVLIHAKEPQTALASATENGAAFGKAARLEFVGLMQLSLVADDLEDGAELRTRPIRVPTRELDEYAKQKQDLKAFRVTYAC